MSCEEQEPEPEVELSCDRAMTVSHTHERDMKPKCHLHIFQTLKLLTGQGLGLSFRDPSSLLFSDTDWAAQQPDLSISCAETREERGLSHAEGGRLLGSNTMFLITCQCQ